MVDEKGITESKAKQERRQSKIKNRVNYPTLDAQNRRVEHGAPESSMGYKRHTWVQESSMGVQEAYMAEASVGHKSDGSAEAVQAIYVGFSTGFDDVSGSTASHYAVGAYLKMHGYFAHGFSA